MYRPLPSKLGRRKTRKIIPVRSGIPFSKIAIFRDRDLDGRRDEYIGWRTSRGNGSIVEHNETITKYISALYSIFAWKRNFPRSPATQYQEHREKSGGADLGEAGVGEEDRTIYEREFH